MKKVSRNAFMDSMDGKKVTLIYGGVVGKNVLEKAIKSLENVNKYRKVTTTPIDEKYTGVFHKSSHGFYRVMANGEKSYKSFAKGDYILSKGPLALIITPDTMHVCVYRVEK